MNGLGIPALRDEIDRIDRELVRLISLRLDSSIEIGRLKAERGLGIRSPDREAELIAEARDDALAAGVSPDYIEELMRLVLRHSRAAQAEALESESRAAG